MADGDPVLEPGTTNLTTLGLHDHTGDSGDGGALVSITNTTMSGHGTFTQPFGFISIFFLDPNGANRNFNPSGSFTNGHIVFVINSAAKGTTYSVTFDSNGVSEVIYPGRMIQMVWDNTGVVWR